MKLKPLLEQHIARATGAEEITIFGEGVGDFISMLNQMLVVVDAAEHVIDDCPDTSREPAIRSLLYEVNAEVTDD